MKTGRCLGKALFLVAILTCFICSTAHAQVPGVVPDLSIWVGQWFKITATQTVFHFADIGVKPTPGYPITDTGNPGYIKIIGWDLGTQTLSGNLYMKINKIWDPANYVPISFVYFAGSDLKFLCSSNITSTYITLNAAFLFKGQRDKSGNFIMGGITTLKTMGGSIYMTDDVPGSTERWAGSAVASGPMVPLSKVPPPIQ
jgi:hypothetical protein